jgi:hypothetical protein
LIRLPREDAYQLAETAAQNGGVVNEADLDGGSSSWKLLLDCGIARHFADGHIVLNPSAVLTGVALADPASVRNDGGIKTCWELREYLLKNGWSFAKDTRSASVLHRRMTKFNCKKYFELLYGFADILEDYEVFSHSQSVGYYNAVHAAIVREPEAICVDLQLCSCLQT